MLLVLIFIVITQCSIHKLYLAGKAEQPAVDLAKIFERRRCNHREAIDEDACLKDVLGAHAMESLSRLLTYRSRQGRKMSIDTF